MTKTIKTSICSYFMQSYREIASLYGIFLDFRERQRSLPPVFKQLKRTTADQEMLCKQNIRADLPQVDDPQMKKSGY